LLFLF
jgi:hypothetical protein